MAKKKLLIAALIVGLLAAALTYMYGSQMKKKNEQIIGKTAPVVKAARNIQAGTPLTEDLITVTQVPLKFMPPNPVEAKDKDIYLGNALAVNVAEGDMILTSDFSVAEISNDLSSKIPADERALSIPVDAISGISGLLTPGDRVDILGTFPVSNQDELIPNAQGGGSVGYVTMTLLQNVTLLAVGQRISSVDQQGRSRGGYSSVTTSVTVEEAELLTIAQTRGKLQLLLRNRDDVTISPVSKRTLKGVLEDLDLIQKQRQKRRKTRVIRRPAKPEKPTGVLIESAQD